MSTVAEANQCVAHRSSPSTISSTTATNAGYKLPHACFPSSASVAQSLRPFPEYNDGLATWFNPVGNSWYDALQVKFTKRYSHGLDVTSNFTYRKELCLGANGCAGINDAFNRNTNRGLTPSSTPFISVTAFTYQTPTVTSNKFIRQLTGGWTWGGILRYASGNLVGVASSRTNLNNYTFNTNTRFNRVAGVNPFLQDPNCGCINPNINQQILNPAAWADTPTGTWGQGAAYYNDYRWQHQVSESMNFGRTFRIREKMSLNIRAEYFNVFNRTYLPTPSANNPVATATFNTVTGAPRDMSGYLKKDLGVKSPITGTADHSHTSSPYTMLAALSQLDIMDGHVYWQHPGSPPPVNTPMVNDPLNSTVVQLSRTAFAGKPYTVSKTNHPFPIDWAAEGIPIFAAYGSLQDWDAIIMYTFEPKRDPSWKLYVGDPFDISLDPVRMTEMATGALTFLRGDVRAARETVARTYSREQVLESRRLPRTEQPYFTPGFPLALPLEHAVRIQSLDGAPTAKFAAAEANPLRSDTNELAWYKSAASTGLITVETDRTQALIGFIPANAKSLKNLSADIVNQFASIVLSSLDAKPLSQSAKMLLTAGSRVTNTGLKWNDAHTRTANQGGSPPLIEPVTGTVVLRDIQAAKAVSASALDGAGHPMGEPIQAKKTAAGWALPIGSPVTTWYVVAVKR